MRHATKATASPTEQRSNKSTTILLAIAAVMLIGLIYGVVVRDPEVACPNELIGAWVTSAKGYEEGVLVITKTREAFSVGAEEIKGFAMGGGVYPETLAQIGRNAMLDPWGTPYQYYRINGTTDVEFTHLAKLKLRKKKPPRMLPAHDSLSTTTDWHIMRAVNTGELRDTLSWNGITGSGTSCRWSVRCIPGQSV